MVHLRNDPLVSLHFLGGWDHAVVGRPEGRAVRIRDETQFTREERVVRTVWTYVYGADGEAAREECLHPLARGGIELVEHAINHQPLRALQQHACEGQTLFLVPIQPLVPAVARVE